jgi:hypothetical protein
MRWDSGNSVAAGTLITLIAMRGFVCSAASCVPGGEGSEMQLEPVQLEAIREPDRLSVRGVHVDVAGKRP